MPEAGDDAIERERRDLGLVVLDQDEASLGRPDFGDGGRHCARQDPRGSRSRPAPRTARWRPCRPDRHRRTAASAPAPRPRLRAGRRRASAPPPAAPCRSSANASRHGAAHQRRGIVEQHQHRALGGRAIVRRKDRSRDRRAPARWWRPPARRRAQCGAIAGIAERSCFDPATDEPLARHRGIEA